jgi:hypothetical protein
MPSQGTSPLQKHAASSAAATLLGRTSARLRLQPGDGSAQHLETFSPRAAGKAGRLCVAEAVSNAVVHAFDESDRRGTITVSATVGPVAVIVVIADHGKEFQVRSDSLGLASDCG